MSSRKDQDFLEFVLDQLSPVKPIVSRRMFGAIGLYHSMTFFAIIEDGRLYFVTDETTRAAYVDRGMAPFQYAPGKFIHTYYEVPVDVLEDDTALCEWARSAVGAQGRRQAKPARSRGHRKARAKKAVRSRGKSG